MFEQHLAMLLVVATLGGLFAVAWWAERRACRGQNPSKNPFVYALSQTTFVTGWALFGDVDSASRTGLGYTALNLGAVLALIFGGSVLRRMVRIKNAWRVTSVADFVSARYGKSHAVGVAVTLLLVVGLVPYIALQFQALVGFRALVASGAPSPGLGPLLVVGLVAFTIALGFKRPAPTERHPGVVMAVCVQSLIKLSAAAALLAFVFWSLFDGPADLFERARASPIVAAAQHPEPLTSWLAALFASASAFLFLPRQFHLAVIENENEAHLRTSMWLVPLFLLVTTLFPLPVALAGLTAGLPLELATSFPLALPLQAGNAPLCLLVLLAGVAASGMMVVVETIALATMVSNNLLLPVSEAVHLDGLRRHFRAIRWVAAALIILGAWSFGEALGEALPLAGFGFVSFAAICQLSPVAVAGMYWRRANKAGALLGLAGGSTVWLYTALLPIVLRASSAAPELLERGPFGIGWLRPEALGGLGLEPTANTVFFSLLANVSLLVLGSLLFDQGDEEAKIAESFVEVLAPARSSVAAGRTAPVGAKAAEKRALIERLFDSFFGPNAAAPMATACFSAAKVPAEGRLSIEQLAGLEAEVERTLASAVGSAAAHVALRRTPLLDSAEAAELAGFYAEVLARLRISPAELRRQVDYYEERMRLLAEESHAQSSLANASRLLSASLDPEATARTTSRLPVPALVEAALLCVEKPTVAGASTSWTVLYADVDGEREQRISAGLEGLTLDDLAPLALAARAGIALWEPLDTPDRWPQALRELERRGSLCIPLIAGQRTLGVTALFCTPGSHYCHPRDLALAQELAFRGALALDNAASYWRSQMAVRTRNELIAMASHELRTPLVPLVLQIQNLQRMLTQGRLTEDRMPRVAGLLAGAEGQLGRLAELIDRMLDASRLSNGKMRLEREWMDLSELAHSLVARNAAQAQRAGCELTVDAPEKLMGYWDRLRLDQSITNLITNAIKYASGKPIALRVEQIQQRVRVRVSDQGPGIDPTDQERIFLPFERAASAQHFPGMGLGLFLARQILEEHGGRMTLESAVGQGATFVAELPLEAQPPSGGPEQGVL